MTFFSPLFSKNLLIFMQKSFFLAEFRTQLQQKETLTMCLALRFIVHTHFITINLLDITVHAKYLM